jgi:hypothetical protein
MTRITGKTARGKRPREGDASVIELLQNLQETLVRKERGTRRKHNAG